MRAKRFKYKKDREKETNIRIKTVNKTKERKKIRENELVIFLGVKNLTRDQSILEIQEG
jgi:hypothetical protein